MHIIYIWTTKNVLNLVSTNSTSKCLPLLLPNPPYPYPKPLLSHPSPSWDSSRQRLNVRVALTNPLFPRRGCFRRALFPFLQKMVMIDSENSRPILTHLKFHHMVSNRCFLLSMWYNKSNHVLYTRVGMEATCNTIRAF